jgi:hypothetical protein
VLNTLTEHKFQDAFKKRQKLWELCICGGWWWPVGPKLIFDQMVATAPEIMDGSLWLCAIADHELIRNSVTVPDV